MSAAIGGGLLMGLGGILLMLGIISLQIASTRANSWLVSAGVMGAFLAAALLAALLLFVGFTVAGLNL
ncbi:MAG: hypothetical protein MUE59_03740 [Thiobacillaceae bacterium]|jgi:hypothetical protein|nr:hypothetical protein [Thiobacillaceae bacterium]